MIVCSVFFYHQFFVDKKKAPAPPPRAITPIPLINNLQPVATPRSVQPSPDSSNDGKSDMDYDKIVEHGKAGFFIVLSQFDFDVGLKDFLS